MPDIRRMLREVCRALRRKQRRLNPIEGVLGDGCRLDLDVEAILRR